MNKLRKFICFLILPIVAVTCFAGCGKARTVEDINNKYSEIMEKYKDFFYADTSGQELVIKYGVEKLTKEEDIQKYNEKKPEIDKILDSSAIDQVETIDANLANRYRAIIGMQEDVIHYTYIYYNALSKHFYDSVDILDVEKDELRELYKKLEDFDDAIAKFETAKSKFEDTIEILTFEGVVRADVTSYSYELNMLIEQCLDFVGYFKDLNIKYLYSGELTEENKADFARHYLYEACYELAEVCYWRYLKAFNNISECDLAKLADLIDMIERMHDPKAAEEERPPLGPLSSIKSLMENSSSFSNEKRNFIMPVVESFQEGRKSYIQKQRIYQMVYEKMDYYKYNDNLVSGNIDEYKKGLSKIEKANVDLIENFYNVTLLDYIFECENMLLMSTVGTDLL